MDCINLFYTRIVLVYLTFFIINMNLNIFVDNNKIQYASEIAEENDAEEQEDSKNFSENDDFFITTFKSQKNSIEPYYFSKVYQCLNEDLIPSPFLLISSPPPES